MEDVSMSHIQEPWILDYARFHGLAIDHRLEDPLKGLISTKCDLNFSDDAGLLQLESFNAAPPPERLTVSKDAAKFLASIRNDYIKDVKLNGSVLPNPHRFRDLKVEIPLLRTDHEQDFRQFCRQVDPDLKNEHFPLEKVDDEQDEGLGWPSSYGRVPEDTFTRISTEKLSVSKDTLLYLQGVLKLHEGIDLQRVIEESLESLRERREFPPITPPLLPMSPEYTPFIPSSEVGHFELLSDNTSPFRDELNKLDQQILRHDAMVPKWPKRMRDSDSVPLDSDSLGDFFSPLKGMRYPPSPPSFKRIRTEDSKVEGPLTPLLCEQLLPWMAKSVSFNDDLLGAISGLPLMEKPENFSSDDIDTMFEETIQPIAEEFNRHIEQEQLQKADFAHRVQVPIMEFSRPVPPWESEICGADGSTPRKTFLAKLKDTHFSEDKDLWQITRKEERALRWAPFALDLAKFDIRETIEEDSSIDNYIARPECLDTNSLIWKPEGLRILDEEDSDNESIENAVFPDRTEFESLMWRRKLELEEKDPKVFADTGIVLTKSLICGPTEAEQSLLNEKPFSALDSVTNFMTVRNHTVADLQVKQSTRIPRPKAISAVLTLESKMVEEHAKIVTTTESDSVVDSAVSMPGMEVPSTPSHFVISSSFLSGNKIVRQLHKLYPSAELIERDFNLHSNKGSLISEADIMLSPGTGLIWTTLQKIKQKSLPGHTAKSPVRDRILRTAPRYENMIILMSAGRMEGNKAVTATLDAQDYCAISELVSFCTSLQQGIEVIFTGGGEQELLMWTISLMVKYSVSVHNFRLLQDETLWEIFLRRAGLNAFAAQAILVELKAPQSPPMTIHSSHTGSTSREYGLVAFVGMSLDERFHRFEHLLGGRGLLRRASDKIDAHWR